MLDSPSATNYTLYFVCVHAAGGTAPDLTSEGWTQLGSDASFLYRTAAPSDETISAAFFYIVVAPGGSTPSIGMISGINGIMIDNPVEPVFDSQVQKTRDVDDATTLDLTTSPTGDEIVLSLGVQQGAFADNGTFTFTGANYTQIQLGSETHAAYGFDDAPSIEWFTEVDDGSGDPQGATVMSAVFSCPLPP